MSGATKPRQELDQGGDLVDRTWQNPNHVYAAQGPIVMIDPVRQRVMTYGDR
jgi:hypothetical protein